MSFTITTANVARSLLRRTRQRIAKIAIPYNVKRCWGLRRLPKIRSEDALPLPVANDSPFSDPFQNSSTLQTLLFMVLGVSLAFFLLGSAFGNPHAKGHRQSPWLAELRVIAAHPSCFLRGGKKGVILCATHDLNHKRRQAEAPPPRYEYHDYERSAPITVNDDIVPLTPAPTVPVPNCTAIEEEMYQRVLQLEEGLMKNAAELEAKDQELVEARMALKAQEIVVQQLQSTINGMFVRQAQESTNNGTNVASELSSLFTIASQLIVAANETKDASHQPSPPPSPSPPDPPPESLSPPPLVKGAVKGAGEPGKAKKDSKEDREKLELKLERMERERDRAEREKERREREALRNRKDNNVPVDKRGRYYGEKDPYKERPSTKDGSKVSKGTLDELQAKLLQVKGQILDLSKTAEPKGPRHRP